MKDDGVIDCDAYIPEPEGSGVDEDLGSSEALQGVWGTRGKRAFISGEQRPNFEGNGTKTILGNREHKKTNFHFLGIKPIYFRGSRE